MEGYNNFEEIKYYLERYNKKSNYSMRACFFSLVGILLLLVISLLLTGCKDVQYITVPEVHTEYIHTRDSIHHTDSIISNRETVVMQLDSAEMARYGIKLKNAEQAWLVKTRELERELQRISELKADTLVVRDSISVPYPVEKKLTKWEKIKIDIGGVSMILVFVFIILGILWLLAKVKKFIHVG